MVGALTGTAGCERQPLRACAYVRVSTASTSKRGQNNSFDQDPVVQEEPLRALIAQRGWTLHRVYSDRASGAKERRLEAMRQRKARRRRRAEPAPPA